ncbi:MAG: Na+-transporting NADH:ubiquinone oxidoreductase subunit C [Glaciecola sp.]|jgi:Na+-transporting NADH:ubiquinone oxidoreductase subunit C
MAVNKEGSAYTFMFAIILVILVGSTLAFTSMALKDTIKKNVNDKKMMNILSSMGVESTRANASVEFEKYITDRILLDVDGKVLNTNEGAIDPLNKEDAFNLDVKKEYKGKIAKLVQKLKNNKEELMTEVAAAGTQYPLFIGEKDGKQLYIMPMVGTGLWGPIWGYVSVEDDFNTIFGAAFDHKTETPGLGAEIKEPFFEKPFEGLKLYDDGGKYVSITARKGGKIQGNPHQVDGITGGTITSNGVNEMLYRSILIYTRYFKTL